MVYEVWSEGYAVTGERSGATLMGRYEGVNFKEACRKMVKDKEMEGLYNEEYNTVWGCKLFDNEEGARKNFG
jgi:hypothetical protein